MHSVNTMVPILFYSAARLWYEADSMACYSLEAPWTGRFQYLPYVELFTD